MSILTSHLLRLNWHMKTDNAGLNKRNVAVSGYNMDSYDKTESGDNRNFGTNATASASGVSIPSDVPSDVTNVLAADGGQSSSRNFQ